MQATAVKMRRLILQVKTLHQIYTTLVKYWPSFYISNWSDFQESSSTSINKQLHRIKMLSNMEFLMQDKTGQNKLIIPWFIILTCISVFKKDMTNTGYRVGICYYSNRIYSSIAALTRPYYPSAVTLNELPVSGQQKD